MGAENHAEFRAATRDPRVVRAMLEDYRAGLTVDRADEAADRAAGDRIGVPVLVLWSLRGRPGRPLRRSACALGRLGRRRARATAIDSGHHMAEEAPEALAAALIDFFARALTEPSDTAAGRRPSGGVPARSRPAQGHLAGGNAPAQLHLDLLTDTSPAAWPGL